MESLSSHHALCFGHRKQQWKESRRALSSLSYVLRNMQQSGTEAGGYGGQA